MLYAISCQGTAARSRKPSDFVLGSHSHSPRCCFCPVADAGRALRADLKVLLITGYVHDAQFWENQLQPGINLLTKPFSIDELKRRIKSVIADSG